MWLNLFAKPPSYSTVCVKPEASRRDTHPAGCVTEAKLEQSPSRPFHAMASAASAARLILLEPRVLDMEPAITAAFHHRLCTHDASAQFVRAVLHALKGAVHRLYQDSTLENEPRLLPGP